MLSTFRTSAVIATLVAVVIIIGLLGLLIRVLMQPLLTMTRAMEDIAEGEGDLTKRLSIHSHDEFGILGKAFNRFVERIHGSIREVSSATEQVNEVALRVISASNSSMANSDEQSTVPTASPLPSTNSAPLPRKSPAMPLRPRSTPAPRACWPRKANRWLSATSPR